MDNKELAQHYKTLLQEVISVLSKKNPAKKTWVETKFDDINYQYEYGKLSSKEIKSLSVDKQEHSGVIIINGKKLVVCYTFAKGDLIRCVDKDLNIYYLDYSSLL
jgi:hypothetical protein